MHIKKSFSSFLSVAVLMSLLLGLFCTTGFAANREQAVSQQKGWRWVLVKSARPAVPRNTDKRFELSTTLNIELGQPNGMSYRLNFLDVRYDWGKMPATLKGGTVLAQTVKQTVNNPEAQRLTHRFTMYRGPSGMSSGGTTAGTRTATVTMGGTALKQLGAPNGSGTAVMKVDIPNGLRSGDRMSVYFNSGVGIAMLNCTAEYVYEWQESADVVESEPLVAPGMDKGLKWVLVKSAIPAVPRNTDKRFELSTTLNIELGQPNGMSYRLNFLDVRYDWGKMPATLKGGTVLAQTVKQTVNNPEAQRLTHRFTMYRGPSGMSSGGTTAGTRTATVTMGGAALKQLGAPSGSGTAVVKVDIPNGLRSGDRMSVYFNSGVGIAMLNCTAEYVYEWQ